MAKENIFSFENAFARFSATINFKVNGLSDRSEPSAAASG